MLLQHFNHSFLKFAKLSVRSERDHISELYRIVSSAASRGPLGYTQVLETNRDIERIGLNRFEQFNIINAGAKLYIP